MHYDLERIIRQWSLQSLRLVPRRAHPKARSSSDVMSTDMERIGATELASGRAACIILDLINYFGGCGGGFGIADNILIFHFPPSRMSVDVQTPPVSMGAPL
jgi:hypothetical protein